MGSFRRGNQIKMRSLGWILIQYDWCPYQKGNLDRETDMQREDDVLYGWKDTSTSQGMPRIVGKEQKLEEARKASPLESMALLITLSLDF